MDPFGGVVEDGFVWGRGAVDMLNLTAAMAAVFRPYRRGEVDPLPGDLLFLAVADEENGGGLGRRPSGQGAVGPGRLRGSLDRDRIPGS